MKHTLDGNDLTLNIEDDLLSTNVKQQLDEAQNLLGQHDSLQSLFVDLTSVKVVDSQGLNFLIGLYQESKRNGWGFRVLNASPALQRLFSFVKLTERFGIQTA